jgi:uncharacterized protein
MSSTAHLGPAFKLVVNGVELRGEQVDDIIRIEVVQEPNTLDHLRLTLANDNPDFAKAITIGARRKPDQFRTFREGSQLVLSLGYGNQLTEVFDGEITGIAAHFPEEGTATLEIHCHSFLHRLIGSARTKTFLNSKDSSIASQIGREVGLRVRAEDSRTKHAFVLQYNQTNLEFLLDRASRIGFELLAEGKTLLFRTAGDPGSSVATLTYGSAADPLLSVSLSEELLGQGDKVTVRAVDPVKGDPIVATALTAALSPPPGQARSGPSVAKSAFGAVENVVVDRPIASRQEADALALSILNGRARGFVTGSGRSLGLPTLKAGGVVQLGGLGKQFNGSYYVVQSTHTFGEDGYLTSFRVRRNAVG